MCGLPCRRRSAESPCLSFGHGGRTSTCITTSAAQVAMRLFFGNESANSCDTVTLSLDPCGNLHVRSDSIFVVLMSLVGVSSRCRIFFRSHLAGTTRLSWHPQNKSKTLEQYKLSAKHFLSFRTSKQFVRRKALAKLSNSLLPGSTARM